MVSTKTFDHHYLQDANSSPSATGNNLATPPTCRNDAALNRPPPPIVPPPIPAPVSVVTILADSAYINSTPSTNSTYTNRTSSTTSIHDSPISQCLPTNSAPSLASRNLNQPTTLSSASVRSSNSSESEEEDMPALLYHHIFTQNNNSMKILVAMSYGLTSSNGTLLADFEKDPLFTKSTRKRQMIPVVDKLIDKVVRRKEFSGDKTKTN